jgi:hypothetical protein
MHELTVKTGRQNRYSASRLIYNLPQHHDVLSLQRRVTLYRKWRTCKITCLKCGGHVWGSYERSRLMRRLMGQIRAETISEIWLCSWLQLQLIYLVCIQDYSRDAAVIRI